jgi:NAD(P)-dependent dehydrogenase (short-subunit alcohol dehydrogenase family)
MRLDGKRVLVVGGSSGGGLAVARRVPDEGGQAILLSRSADKLTVPMPRWTIAPRLPPATPAGQADRHGRGTRRTRP